MCLGKKHVPSETGFERCPECFLKTSIQRLLKAKGYPPEWYKVNLTAFSTELGANHPVVLAVRQVVEERGKAVHFYGPPTRGRQVTLAAVLRGFAAKYQKIDVVDTGLLSPKYFGNAKTEVVFSTAPIVIILGKEIETKIGAFYFRQAIEYASSRRLPIALFTDLIAAHMANRYHDFEELIKLGKFQSISLENVREIT